MFFCEIWWYPVFFPNSMILLFSESGKTGDSTLYMYIHVQVVLHYSSLISAKFCTSAKKDLYIIQTLKP